PFALERRTSQRGPDTAADPGGPDDPRPSGPFSQGENFKLTALRVRKRKCLRSLSEVYARQGATQMAERANRSSKYLKTEGRYRPAITSAKRPCGTCIHCQEIESDCTMVEGRIKLNFVSNFWKLKPPSVESGLCDWPRPLQPANLDNGRKHV